MTEPFVVTADREPVSASINEPQPMIIEAEEMGRLIIEAPPRPVAEVQNPASRGFGIAVALFALGLLGLAGLSVGEWLLDLADRHWAMAAVGGVFIGGMVLGAMAWIGREMAALARLRTVDDLLVRSATLGEDSDAARTLMEDIIRSLPSSVDPSKWREASKGSRADDVLDLFNSMVLAPLDQQASTVVKRAAVDAAMLVAVSPTTLTDTAVFVVRATSLTTDVASVYGHRPGKFATIALMRRLMREVGVVAATDLLGDAMTTAVGEMVGKALGKVTVATGEGIIVGQRMARIGFLAMSVCRPLPFPEGQRPKLSDLLRN
jgi:putative membrane protein